MNAKLKAELDAITCEEPYHRTKRQLHLWTRGKIWEAGPPDKWGFCRVIILSPKHFKVHTPRYVREANLDGRTESAGLFIKAGDSV